MKSKTVVRMTFDYFVFKFFSKAQSTAKRKKR